MEQQVETMKAPQPQSRGETKKNLWGCTCTATLGPQGPLTLSKSEGPGVIESFIGMGIVGFWFGIGFMLAVKTEQSGSAYKKIIKWKKKISNK